MDPDALVRHVAEDKRERECRLVSCGTFALRSGAKPYLVGGGVRASNGSMRAPSARPNCASAGP
jgi:hypothetical protein